MQKDLSEGMMLGFKPSPNGLFHPQTSSHIAAGVIVLVFLVPNGEQYLSVDWQTIKEPGKGLGTVREQERWQVRGSAASVVWTPLLLFKRK